MTQLTYEEFWHLIYPFSLPLLLYFWNIDQTILCGKIFYFDIMGGIIFNFIL